MTDDVLTDANVKAMRQELTEAVMRAQAIAQQAGAGAMESLIQIVADVLALAAHLAGNNTPMSAEAWEVAARAAWAQEQGEELRPIAIDVPNYLGRIEQIWAALSLDEGGEGVIAAPMGGMTLPLIAADKRRLDQIVPIAKRVANMFGKPVRLAKFSQREDVEVYQPSAQT